MKLKYYLRGLGIGIIVTTILLMIAFALHKPTMSDADIIARAKQLGMVMPEDEEPLQDTETTENTEVTAVPETEAAQIEEQTTEAAANTEEPVTADETENPESEMTDTEVATEVSSEANEELSVKMFRQTELWTMRRHSASSLDRRALHLPSVWEVTPFLMD